MNKKSDKLVFELQNIGKLIIVFIFFAMVLMTFTNAVLRYFVAWNFPIFEGLSRFAFVWIAFLGAIVAYIENRHIGVDIIISKLHGKKKLVVQMLGHVVIISCLLIIGKGAVDYFIITQNAIEPSCHLPFGVLTSSGLVLDVSMLLIAVRNTIKDIKAFKYGGSE